MQKDAGVLHFGTFAYNPQYKQDYAMTAEHARKQKAKAWRPLNLPGPVQLQPRTAEKEELVKIDATLEQMARTVLRPVKIVEDPDA